MTPFAKKPQCRTMLLSHVSTYVSTRYRAVLEYHPHRKDHGSLWGEGEMGAQGEFRVDSGGVKKPFLLPHLYCLSFHTV